MIFIISQGMPCFSSYIQKHTKLRIDGKLRLKHKTKPKTVKPFFTQFGNMLESLSLAESSLVDYVTTKDWFTLPFST